MSDRISVFFLSQLLITLTTEKLLTLKQYFVYAESQKKFLYL